MSARLEKVENGQAIVKMEISEERFEEGLKFSYRKVVKDITVPGFRKGKAPRQILEAQFGREVLYEDALEFVLPSAFADAVTELELEPIGRPEYEFETIEAGQPLEVTVTIPVRPEVKLGVYDGLQVEIPLFSVKEEQVDSLLEDMRNRYAQSYEKTEEPAAAGDNLLIDFAGYLNGEIFSGGQASDYPLLLGSNTFIPGFEDQLIGAKLGEEVEVNVTFPEEYHSEDLKGQEVMFKVTVNKITSRQLRELNDEFAQEISDFDSLEELKANIREDLTASYTQKKNENIKEKIIGQLIETSELAVAPGVISEEADRMMEQFDHRLHHQGFSLDRYLAMIGSNLERFKEEMKGEAEKSIKTHFILEKVALEKGITVSDEELDENIAEIAQKAEKTLEETKEMLGDSIMNIKLNMTLDKAMQSLIESAIVTEVEEASSAEA